MRFSKFQVVAVTLTCLLVSGSAQAQFGKLKSLAKEKLGIQTKEDKKPDASGPAGDGNQDKMSPYEGEAKATFAPGVEKSLEVWRKGGPTPEATIAEIEGGRSQEVTIKVSHVDARQIDSVRGYKPCNKLDNFQIVSATQMKMTIDLSANTEGSSCSLSFRSGGKTVFYTNASILDVATVKQNRRMEAMRREGQLPFAQQVALGKKRVGKLWTVQYASGKTDKWSLVGPARDNDLKYRFKTASGQTFEILYAVGTATIDMGGCMMQATLDDSKSSEGTAMSDCDVPLGTKFTATIE